MFYLVLIYTSVKLTFITQKYVIFLLAVLGHHRPLADEKFILVWKHIFFTCEAL